MRIAYVTQWFEPEPNIVKGVAFVRALEAAGHQVTVVTGLPNYPTGRIYEGYRLRLIQRETLDGVKVVRLPLYPSHDRSTLRRSLNYLSFFASAFAYLLCRGSRFDLAYVYHPPITVGLAAALARVPFVLDVQDLWPDTISATGMAGNSKLVGPLGACCRFVYAKAAFIIVQSEGMKRALIERGVPEPKVSVILNWAQSESRDASADLPPEGPFTIVYGGNFGAAQNLGNVIEAAAILERERPEIRIVLFGSGVEEGELRDQAERYRLRNLRFGGRLGTGAFRREMAAADALLLNLGDDDLFEITIPSKTQHYLAVGRPIVAAVNGEVGQILRRSGSAIVVPPAKPEDLAAAIISMADMPSSELEQMGSAGAQFYRQHFSFSKGIDRTVSLLEGTYAWMARGLGR